MNFFTNVVKRAIVGFLPFLAVVSQAQIDYRVAVEPTARAVRVGVTFPNAKEKETFRIPAWCPGFYFILNYQNSMYDVRALDPSGRALKMSFLREKRAWEVQNPKKTPISFQYRVRGTDAGLGFFGVHVREYSAFLNGPAAFVHVLGREKENHRVTFTLPGGWDIATGMDSNAGVYTAPDYDEFIDHPIQLGRFIRKTFQVDGTPFEVIWVAGERIRCLIDEETERFRKLSIPAKKMFGEYPFKRYVYIVHLEVGDFGGGLEHRASTVLATPNAQVLGMDDLIAHEFFHTWNVKQIRPDVLGPFDYTQPVRTGSLWFAEGVTDYYAKVHTYQSGLRPASWLIEEMANEIETLQMSKTRLKLSVADAGRKAWENGGFGVDDLSYYNKGLVMGFLLDLEIRRASKGAHTLDDLFRKLYKEHRLPNSGFSEKQLVTAINEVAGVNLTKKLNSMIETPEELDYSVLDHFGLRLIEPGKSYLDPWFTVDLESKVLSIGPSIKDSGLKPGDQIVSGTAKADDMVLQVRRGSDELSLTIAGRRYIAGDYRIQVSPFATPEQRANLQQYLKF